MKRAHCSRFVPPPPRSIISLIANVGRSSEVMAEVFKVMRDSGVQVKSPCRPLHMMVSCLFVYSLPIKDGNVVVERVYLRKNYFLTK